MMQSIPGVCVEPVETPVEDHGHTEVASERNSQSARRLFGYLDRSETDSLGVAPSIAVRRKPLRLGAAIAELEGHSSSINMI